MNPSVVTDQVIRPHYKRETTTDLLAMKFAKGQDVWFVIEYVKFYEEEDGLHLNYNYKIVEGELTISKEDFDKEIGDFIMQILKYGSDRETPVGVVEQKPLQKFKTFLRNLFS